MGEGTDIRVTVFVEATGKMVSGIVAEKNLFTFKLIGDDGYTYIMSLDNLPKNGTQKIL